VLTFSGEIYNFRELRRELEGHGHAFRTRSDTEVLLRSWLQWGEDCLPRLNGMFAFAVWDSGREELFLARDRMGIKPLCYAPLPGGGVFNVPWALKLAGLPGEKGLLRRAADGLLPREVLDRRKSIYPASTDPEYAGAVQAQMADLLSRPGEPLFGLVDHGRLAGRFRADPTLPGLMGIQPSPWAPAAFLLDVNGWLADYRVALV